MNKRRTKVANESTKLIIRKNKPAKNTAEKNFYKCWGFHSAMLLKLTYILGPGRNPSAIIMLPGDMYTVLFNIFRLLHLNFPCTFLNGFT